MSSDERVGIVRLELPDGRCLRLQLTYAALDVRGHGWVLDQLRVMQNGKAGAMRALADVLELMTNGQVTSEDVMHAPVHAYPLGSSLRAVMDAWKVAQYGPDGPPERADQPDPQKRRPTLLGKLFGRR